MTDRVLRTEEPRREVDAGTRDFFSPFFLFYLVLYADKKRVLADHLAIVPLNIFAHDRPGLCVSLCSLVFGCRFTLFFNCPNAMDEPTLFFLSLVGMYQWFGETVTGNARYLKPHLLRGKYSQKKAKSSQAKRQRNACIPHSIQAQQSDKTDKTPCIGSPFHFAASFSFSLLLSYLFWLFLKKLPGPR